MKISSERMTALEAALCEYDGGIRVRKKKLITGRHVFYVEWNKGTGWKEDVAMFIDDLKFAETVAGRLTKLELSVDWNLKDSYINGSGAQTRAKKDYIRRLRSGDIRGLIAQINR